MGEKEAQGPYVPAPSQAHSIYPPWYPVGVFYSRVWDIISCMLTELNGFPTVAYPGAYEETYPALFPLAATGVVTGKVMSVPPEKFERLVQEHRDLYEKCACLLYPEDRNLCKKGVRRRDP